MYCTKCNTKGKIGDVYCSECGTKLIRKKFDIKISNKVKKRIIIGLVSLIVILSSYKIVEYIYSPGFIAKNYFKAVINNNSSLIYTYLDEYESDFVSQDTLEEKMSLYEEVTSYKIENITYNNDNVIVEFSYVMDNNTYTAYVLLKKENNKFLIFNNYSVSSGNIVENVSFKVPTGTVITIDGIDITKYKTSDEYYDLYEIPYMINGTYEVKTSINGIEHTEDVEVNDDVVYYLGNIELSDELGSSLENITKEKLNLIYSSIINDVSFDSISSNFNVDTSSLEKSYKTIKRSLESDYYKVNSFVITDAVVSSANYNSEGKLTVTFDVDYKINYTLSDNSETKEVESYSYIEVTFDYIDSTYTFYDLEKYIGLRS